MKEEDIRIGQQVVCLPRVLGKLWTDSEWYGKIGKVKDCTITLKKPLYKIEFADATPYWAKPNEIERVKE